VTTPEAGHDIPITIEIFKNLFKAQDARINFYKLTIKKDKTFSDFYT
jgi:hypothetical protein